MLRQALTVLRDGLLKRSRAAPHQAHQLSERLALALKAGRSGLFEWDAKSNTNVWSPELLELYGMPADMFGGRAEDWIATLVPEDRDAGVAALERSLATGEFACRFRICRRDNGEVRWMDGRGTVLFDATGKPERMVGINVDITDLQQAEDALRQSEERRRLALLAVSHGAG